MLKKITPLTTDDSGAVAVVTAICLVLVCSLAALALDLGHLTSVKNELQIAADAGALAGARSLCTQVPASAAFVNKPNWSLGATNANDIVDKNFADGHLITSADVQAGYWNLTWKMTTAPKDANGAITLLPQSTPANPLYVPAVRVKIDKKAGTNSGKVQFSFAKVLGKTNADLSGQAVAAVFPMPGKGIGSVPAQSCFPFATPLTWVQQHWNDDPALSFYIGSEYHSPDGGQWTSFMIDAQNVPVIRDLINNGNPTPLTVGDQIWIEPGTKSTLYSDLAVDIGKIGLLPVVPDDFETNHHATLLAFVAFYLEDCGGSGNSAYLKGHFVKNYVDYDGTPGSQYNFGANAAAPALVD